MTRKKIYKPKEKKLHIGCGYNHFKGYFNIDTSKFVKPDAVVDIEQGLPFPDNHFNEIYSSHVLEHIRPDKWLFVLNEIARVSKHKCKLILDLPHDNLRTRTLFDHYRTFSYNSFYQMHHGHNRNYYCDLILVPMSPVGYGFWYKLTHHFFDFAFWNIHFEFLIVKDRQDDSLLPELKRNAQWSDNSDKGAHHNMVRVKK